MTNVPIADIGCAKCHPADNKRADGTDIDPATYEPTCADCHATGGDEVADATCLKCHSRQGLEIGPFALSDVHRTAEIMCSDCHTSTDLHGDGTAYNSMLEPGAISAKCENCHPTDSLATNTSHTIHSTTVDCASCHMQT